jgi:hypothetical protein
VKKIILISGFFSLLIAVTYFLPYGTWAELGDLPAHPLIVHGVVVLLPLVSLLLIAGLFKSELFEKAHLLLIAVLGTVTVGVLAAKSSGDSLAAAVGLPEFHAEWGNNLVPIAIASICLSNPLLVLLLLQGGKERIFSGRDIDGCACIWIDRHDVCGRTFRC